MATIKAIERQSVHQIQSGQVIVDLCSVVKELVENSLDAGATSIDVRLKGNGLDLVEVQDNGQGISPENYESIALKHYTSKLSSYAELDSLETFGFRGEALSSLCAVSDMYIVTAQAREAPKGMKLEFERSGKLKATHVAASPKGTTIIVEGLFKNLPVRRRELEKNIKREYVKVLAVLQAYACISAGVKFTVSNQTNKGKRAVVFATKSNKTTRENIANVFGSKTLASLMPLDIESELAPKPAIKAIGNDDEGIGSPKTVRVLGHISRPAFGEARQAPDRQMFFVNRRPCGLPQVARAFNEVYKSYSVSQSPFIFADLQMDTSSYDVNVSPDKRTIFIHDQSAMLEALRSSVAKLLEDQTPTLPHNQLTDQRLPAFKKLSITRQSTDASGAQESDKTGTDGNLDDDDRTLGKAKLRETEERASFPGLEQARYPTLQGRSLVRGEFLPSQVNHQEIGQTPSEPEDADPEEADPPESSHDSAKPGGLGSTPQGSPTLTPSYRRQHTKASLTAKAEEVPSISFSSYRQRPGALQGAFDHMRSKRRVPDTATITINSKTVISPLNISSAKRPRLAHPAKGNAVNARQNLAGKMRAFVAPHLRGEAAEDGLDGAESARLDSDEGSLSLSDPEQSEDDAGASSGIDAPTGPDGATADGGGHFNNDIAQDVADEYFDEAEEHEKEEGKVAELIHIAEQQAHPTTDTGPTRLRALKGGVTGDDTVQLVQTLNTSVGEVERKLASLQKALEKYQEDKVADGVGGQGEPSGVSPEERLSLSVSKDDFRRMRIVGQFNLGFILATRRATTESPSAESTIKTQQDELFIIDQHASDEIYNFERLQATTVVQSQPLVTPRLLNLTAIEEETLIENQHVLQKNGFVVEVDGSGAEPVGRRCRLVSLPMSREVVFDMRDLEELLALLAEAPPVPQYSRPLLGSSNMTTTSTVPRPSKVRRMFAMRACRSSIMIGRTLTPKQMATVVRHMGEMHKPWNCPHGRPTMRHVASLNTWGKWQEGGASTGGVFRQSEGDAKVTDTTEDDDDDDDDDDDEYQEEEGEEEDEEENPSRRDDRSMSKHVWTEYLRR